MFKNFKLMKNMFLPTPLNISNMWSMGVMVSLSMVMQIVSGIFISMNYSNHINNSFISYMMISRDIQKGFITKFFHSNGASFMFIFIYIHIFRSMNLNSPKNFFMWISGIILIFILMGTAFLGYVLPWGQMSFWAATVITNLISSIPYAGEWLTKWIWGGFSVGNPTLNRFFSFHFLLPLIMSVFSLIHLAILHKNGSSMPLGMNSNMEKIPFKQFFASKDLLIFLFLLIPFFLVSMEYSLIFMDSENFIPANPLVTPNHIQPEWYFLFAYAILRSIPNKMGGVLALVSSILILISKSFFSGVSKFNFINLLKNNFLMMNFFILTFLGAQQIEEPFLTMSQLFSLSYFLLFLNLSFLKKKNKINKNQNNKK